MLIINKFRKSGWSVRSRRKTGFTFTYCLLACLVTSSFQYAKADNLQKLQLLKHPYLSGLHQLQRVSTFGHSTNTGKPTDNSQHKTASYHHTLQPDVNKVHHISSSLHPRSSTVDSRTIIYARSRTDTYPWSTLINAPRRPTDSKPETYSSRLQTNPMFRVSAAPSKVIPTVHNSLDTGPTSNEFYKVMYGTHEGVEHLKSNYGPTHLSQAKVKHGVAKDLEDVKLANEHFLRMRSLGRCKAPRPELVRVKDFYPDPGKEYLPRCTLLHRCGERSGCCDSDDLRCVPKVMQEVALNFYTIHLGMHQSEVGLDNSVEKLFFVNHTECECVPMNDTPRQSENEVNKYSESEVPKDSESDEPNEPQLQDANSSRHQERHQKDEQQKNGISRCRECPVPFCKREFPDGRCSCDCFDKQKPCLRVKRGRDPLPEIDRRCVESGKCNIPDCEYGPYDMSASRCPKRPDDYHRNPKNINSNHRNLHNPNHRWTYFERD